MNNVTIPACRRRFLSTCYFPCCLLVFVLSCTVTTSQTGADKTYNQAVEARRQRRYDRAIELLQTVAQATGDRYVEAHREIGEIEQYRDDGRADPSAAMAEYDMVLHRWAQTDSRRGQVERNRTIAAGQVGMAPPTENGRPRYIALLFAGGCLVAVCTFALRRQGLVREAEGQSQSDSATVKATPRARQVSDLLRDSVEAYDVFISYAGEDSDEVARPLAVELQSRGLAVWFAEFRLSPGHSLYDEISSALINSRVAVVVLSTAYFNKKWPRAELKALFQRDLYEGNIIVPVLHNISGEQLRVLSVLISDRVYATTAKGLAPVVDAVIAAVGRVKSQPNQEPPSGAAAQPDNVPIVRSSTVNTIGVRYRLVFFAVLGVIVVSLYGYLLTSQPAVAGAKLGHKQLVSQSADETLARVEENRAGSPRSPAEARNAVEHLRAALQIRERQDKVEAVWRDLNALQHAYSIAGNDKLANHVLARAGRVVQAGRVVP